jgi:hypothetical protein
VEFIRTTLKNAKQRFDRNLPQKETVPINYFALCLHWKVDGKQENWARNKWKIP